MSICVPGMYVVTFALTGFQTVRRQGVQLQAEFNATVDAEMKVGDRQETITVTAEAPTVDVRSAAVVTRLDREVLDQIPTGQNIWEMAQLIPSINLFNVLAQNAGTVGGQGGATQTYMSVRGMSAAQNVVLVDGMSVSGLELNGTVQAYFNADMNQEIDYQTSGASADRSGGGVTVNMIPREGGNRPSGNFKTNYRPGRWIGDNFTARLRDMGMLSSGTLEYLSDFTGSQGGPIKRDRLWFFASYHQFNTGDAVPGTLFDDGAQGTDKQHIRQPMVRLTYQLTPSQQGLRLCRDHRQAALTRHGVAGRSGNRGLTLDVAELFDRQRQIHLDDEQPAARRRGLFDEPRIPHGAGTRRDLQGSRHTGMVRVGKPDAADRRQRAYDGADDLVHT